LKNGMSFSACFWNAKMASSAMQSKTLSFITDLRWHLQTDVIFVWFLFTYPKTLWFLFRSCYASNMPYVLLLSSAPKLRHTELWRSYVSSMRRRQWKQFNVYSFEKTFYICFINNLITFQTPSILLPKLAVFFSYISTHDRFNTIQNIVNNSTFSLLS
jgi:hypothetical protein